MRRVDRVWKKLDRILFNSAWLSDFTCVSVVVTRATSDHVPLLYRVHFQQPSMPKSSKFQDMWLGRAVVRSCLEEQSEGYGMLRFSLKLWRLKHVLREWNKDNLVIFSLGPRKLK